MTNFHTDALISSIYDCALDSERWPAFLDDLAQQANFAYAVIQVSDPRDFSMASMTTSNFDTRRLAEQYLDEYLPLDVVGYQELLRADARVMLDDSFIMRNYHGPYLRSLQEWLADFGIQKRSAMRLGVNQHELTSFAIGFHDKRHARTNPDLEQLEILAPHLEKALQMQTRLSAAMAGAAFVDGLDQSNYGVVIVDACGHVLFNNLAAEQILRENDGLFLSPDGVIAAADPTNDILLNAIRRCAALVEERQAVGDFYIPCPRRARAEPLLLEVFPLLDHFKRIGERLRGALIVIVDPDRARMLSERQLAAVYRLSDGEAALCRDLLHGRALDEIAERANLARAAARMRVRALYHKLGVASRVALVRLAHAISPGQGGG